MYFGGRGQGAPEKGLFRGGGALTLSIMQWNL